MSALHITAATAGLALAVVLWLWRRQTRRLRAETEDTRARLATLQDQHSRAAAQARAEQQTLFNSMAEGVLVLDEQGRIRLANQTIERLFGTTIDLRGKTVLEAFRLHELQELVHRAFVEGHVVDTELNLPVLDHRCLQVNASVFLDAAGRRQGVVLVCHDLTRLRQLENTRREFVANVSHELRTPLSLIKGYCETLIDGAKDDPAVALRFLRTIEKHADRLTFLIEDLLTISRLESGHLALNRQPTDAREAIDAVLHDLGARAADRGITLLNRAPAGLCADADADRLQQALFNLVDNAIKYGRPQGRVEAGAQRRSEKELEFFVRDDGPGIPADAQARVFERFFRVDKARSRDAGGTGLGLAIVKHIVQAHGGEVRLESDEGQGTTFFLTLPAAATPAGEPDPAG